MSEPLKERVAKVLAEEVGPASRRIGHDKPNRLDGVVLSVGAYASQEREGDQKHAERVKSQWFLQMWFFDRLAN